MQHTPHSKHWRYLVIEMHSGQERARCTTLKRARTALDRLDNAYGGYAHRISRPAFAMGCPECDALRAVDFHVREARS